MYMKKVIKRIIVLFIILASALEVFAAVVSDNDGAAFITKAEFDSLQNNFQSQIDSFNKSVDSKIDNTIANYLASVVIARNKVLSPNINEIVYPIEIIHHKKSIEEADDDITTEFPQLEPLWRPSWKLMTLNVRGNYRIYDKFEYPKIDNINDFVAGYKYDNNTYKMTGTASGFNKTCNFFYLLDGWPSNAQWLTYIIIADCNNDGNWGYSKSAGQAIDRSGYIVNSYNDLFKYSDLETGLKLTNFSTTHSKAGNKVYVSSSDNFKKWTCSDTNMWHGPAHGAAYNESGNTVEYGTPSYKTTFSKVYNNNTGNCLAPVSYYINNKYELYYTNKQKNRIFYQYDSTGISNITWSFETRSSTTTHSDKGVSGILTRGFNLESELENTSRNWFNKSLIKQSRIVYNFTSGSDTVKDHKMGEGIPIFIFQNDKIGGSNYKIVKVKLNLATAYPSNKKYIVFSKRPITLNDYSTDVTSNTNYEVISECNGTEYTTTTRKVELIPGDNTIVLNNFKSGDILYYKILWNTTEVKNGTNYNDEYVTISDPSLDITYE